jgi:hypothetical protein
MWSVRILCHYRVTDPDVLAAALLHDAVEVLDAEPWARMIKLSDLTANGVGIIHTTGSKVTRSARKCAPAIPVLRELLDRADTPLPPPVKDHIRAQLDLAQHRFTAILAA